MYIHTYVYMCILYSLVYTMHIHACMRPLPGIYLRTIRSEYIEVGLEHIESSAGSIIGIQVCKPLIHTHT